MALYGGQRTMGHGTQNLGASGRRLRLLSAAMEQCREGIAVLDVDGRFAWVNAAFARMHGYRPAELLRIHVAALFSRGNMLTLAAANQRVRQLGEFAFEFRQLRKDGTEFVALFHASLVKDHDGEPLGTVMLVRDITETKLAERVLRLSREDLSRRRAELDTEVQHGTQRLTTVGNELERSARERDRAEQAVRIILAECQEQRRRVEKEIHRNLAVTILPIIDQLKTQQLPEQIRLLVQSLEFSINNLFASFGGLPDQSESRLTPRESQLCELIRTGLTSKQIATIMGVSPSTVITHRTNIRKKLGLVGSEHNLSVHLKIGL